MSSCPAIEVLEAVVAGRTDDAAILAHVEACSHCQQQTAQLREHNALLGQLQVVSLPRLAAAFAETSVETVAPPSDLIPGYEILAEVARGGQGVVYQAIQKSTKRKVALKIMKEGPFADGRDRVRFEREAQILGQLNHPNVVAILDSGAAHGCFYLVTRYISGQTLDAYLAAQTGAKSKASPALADRLRLFVKICDAVNAAHLRGVIHRDLKPSNIRIDHDDEPHVLDFGLAKLAIGNITDDSHPQAMTRTGQFMGSLPWASPEQAEALPDQIDVRTDVYSLGIILYQMLTERFPYEVRGNLRDVLDNILRVEPIRPRTLDKRLDDEMETIVLKCLAKKRERRYQSAGELARDIRHYLAGEPIEAKRASTLYLLAKTLRRYRVPAFVAAAFVLLITASSVALGFLYAGQRRERTRAEAAFVRADEQRVRAEAALRAAAEQRTLAQANEQRARDEAARAEREAETARQERDKAEKIAQFMEEMLKGAGPAVARGRDTTMLREMLDAAAKRIEDGELKAAPEAEMHLRLTMGDTYRELAHGDAYDRAERLLRPALDLARALHPGDQQVVARSLGTLAALLNARGDLAGAEPLYREALAMCRRLFPGDHLSVATSLNNLASLLQDRGNLAEAEPLYREALDMDRRLFPGDHPAVALDLNNLAALLQARGDLAAAEPLCREVLEMQRRLFPGDHPYVAVGLNNLAQLLQTRDDLAGAEPLCREALAMTRRLFPGDHPDVATNLNNLAQLLYARDALAEAEPLFREALDMRRRLFPGDHAHVATSLNNLAQVLKARGDLAGTEPLLREALAMTRRLFPGDHADVALGLHNLGRLLENRGDRAAAESLLREALEMKRRLYPGAHPDVAIGLYSLAGLLYSQGDLAGAEPLFREALAMFRQVLPPAHWYIGTTANHLGRCWVGLGRYAEAEPLLLEAAHFFQQAQGVPKNAIVSNWRALIQLYDAWHAAEPDKGYDAKAAEWRVKLAEWQAATQPASQPAPATP